MEIHKGLVELAGYGVNWNGVSVIPIELWADDTNCKIRFGLVDDEQNIQEVTQQGPHEDFVFTSEILGQKYKIKLKTGVMSKVYIPKDRDDNDCT